MRELERRPSPPSARAPAPTHVAIVGAGRLGTLFAAALRAAGLAVDGPLRRGQAPDPHADLVVLCVPDAAIASVAASVPAGPLVAHCSGATGLDALGPRDGFSLHPLVTVAPGAEPDLLHGASAAIDATEPRARAAARSLASALGLRAIEIDVADRAAYHAAASIAANFLITLEAAAERIGASAGLPRAALVPLVRGAVDNWATRGPHGALTGPIARGDEATVARQRDAIASRTPELLELFDALAAATRALSRDTDPQPEIEPVSC